MRIDFGQATYLLLGSQINPSSSYCVVTHGTKKRTSSLTIPLEKRFEETYERKAVKYVHLKDECQRKDGIWLEVWTTGFLAKSLWKISTELVVTGLERNQIICSCKLCSWISILLIIFYLCFLRGNVPLNCHIFSGHGRYYWRQQWRRYKYETCRRQGSCKWYCHVLCGCRTYHS